MIRPVSDPALTAPQRGRLLAAHRRLIRQTALGALVFLALFGGLAVISSSSRTTWALGLGVVVLVVLVAYADGCRNLSEPGHARDLAASGSAADVRRVGDQIRSERAVADADRAIAFALVEVWADTYARRWLYAGLTVVWAAIAFLGRDLAGVMVVPAAISAMQYVQVTRLGRRLRNARALGFSSSEPGVSP